MTEIDSNSIAQTFSRGLQVIELLAASRKPMTVYELAAKLGLSRSIVYRLLRTLESHGLLDTDAPDGRFALGLGLLTLSRGVVRDLRETALPELASLTGAFTATSFIGVRQGDEVVCVVSVEPESLIAAIRHREGMRLPLSGASGIAVLASAPEKASDSAAVKSARRRGFSVSRGKLFPGALGVAAPVRRTEGPRSTVCIIFAHLDESVIDAAGAAVVAAADRIASRFTM